MSEAFRLWLSQELDRRKWSHREFARQSGVSQTQISAVIAGDRKANADFCVRAALTLDISLDYVLKLAGILPGQPAQITPGPVTQEIVALVESLPPDKRRQILAYARFIASLDEE